MKRTAEPPTEEEEGMDGESAQAQREGTLGYTSLTTAFSSGGGEDQMEAAAEEEEEEEEEEQHVARSRQQGVSD